MMESDTLLLAQLLAMIDSTKFEQCTSARLFKGTYDVWHNRHHLHLLTLQDRAEKLRQAEQADWSPPELEDEDELYLESDEQ